MSRVTKNVNSKFFLDGLVSFVWLGWSGFSQAYSYLGLEYNFDITWEIEIWHAGSTHKNKMEGTGFGQFDSTISGF